MAFETFTPIEYLKMDVAANFGLDKENWQPRLDWFDENESQIAELAGFHEQIEAGKMSDRAISQHPLVAQAEEPALFYAGVRAWAKASQGKPIGYPVSLDATASGAQIMACLMNCRDSAEMCNVIDTTDRQDFYTWSYRALLARTSSKDALSRGMLKAAIMPWFYGSSAEPKQAFGEGALLYEFYDTMDDEAPGIVELRQLLIDAWQPFQDTFHWVMPDNFNVVDRVEDLEEEDFIFEDAPGTATFKVNRGTERGVKLAANVIHAIDGMVVREMGRRCYYDRDRIAALLELLLSDKPGYEPRKPRKQDELVIQLWDHYLDTGFLSARILELLDEENIHLVDADPIRDLIATLPEAPFQFLSVHDCFRCHPNYANDLRRTYIQLLYEIAASDLLDNLLTQLKGHPVSIPKMDPTMVPEILETNYALS